jgi:rhodanese-related sulfurtransferase
MRALSDRFDDLLKDSAVVVLCHHGVRSNAVAHALLRAGCSEVYNVRGGIDAWANEVDRTLATY